MEQLLRQGFALAHAQLASKQWVASRGMQTQQVGCYVAVPGGSGMYVQYPGSTSPLIRYMASVIGLALYQRAT